MARIGVWDSDKKLTNKERGTNPIQSHEESKKKLTNKQQNKRCDHTSTRQLPFDTSEACPNASFVLLTEHNGIRTSLSLFCFSRTIIAIHSHCKWKVLTERYALLDVCTAWFLEKTALCKNNNSKQRNENKQPNVTKYSSTLDSASPANEKRHC